MVGIVAVGHHILKGVKLAVKANVPLLGGIDVETYLNLADSGDNILKSQYAFLKIQRSLRADCLANVVAKAELNYMLNHFNNIYRRKVSEKVKNAQAYTQMAGKISIFAQTYITMSRKNKPLPLYQDVEITAIAAEGRAIARVDDLVVFVPFVVPGDIVDIQVTRKKNKYCEGVAVAIKKQSEVRDIPFCKYFGVCGGCRWQNLKYTEQQRWKQQIVSDALHRIGKVELPEFRPIVGSGQIKEFRNKLEFGFSNKRWLTKEEIAQDVKYDNMNAVGFHVPGAFDKIIDIDYCGLMDNWQNSVRNEVREYAFSHGLSFFNIRAHEGLIRNMMLRKTSVGETMILLQFHYDDKTGEQQALSLMEHLMSVFPDTTSLMYVNNLKLNDTIGDLDIQTYAGRDFIYETMRDLRFKIGPKSFFQTNTYQAIKLYDVAAEFASLTGNEIVYDLYTGTGTIANYVARKAKRVVGIEYVEEAIEDAKVNAELNNITNTEFYAGDMKDVLTPEFIAAKGTPDVIITDPPRAGMHKDVVDTILQARPQRVVYVSCNPATQARDLQLMDADYKVVAVQPVDMFPQTQHVENVCLLERRA